MEKKMTYAQALEIAINTITDEVVKERLVALKGSLVKKAENKKPTATQKANETLKAQVIEYLGTLDKGVTVSEIIKAEPFKEMELSNQKMTAILRLLGDEVVKTTDGKKTLFSLAPTIE